MLASLTVLGFDLTFLQTALLDALPIAIAGGLIYLLIRWLSTPAGAAYSQYMPFVIQAVHFAEKYADPASTDPVKHKIGLFLQEFERAYSTETGNTPDQALKDWALRVKEVVLHELAVAAAAAPVINVTPAPTTPPSTTPTV